MFKILYVGLGEPHALKAFVQWTGDSRRRYLRFEK